MSNVKKIGEVYKCNVCGNIVEVLFVGGGELVCCGQPMELLKENTVDAAREKHLPVIEKTKNGYKIRVGSLPHPMEKAHYIQWIELIADGVSYKRSLAAGDKPKAEFCLKTKNLIAREHCNLHGLWKS